MKNLSKAKLQAIQYVTPLAIGAAKLLGSIHRKGQNAQIHDNKYWNYFPVPHVETVLKILLMTECKHLAELGSGFPIIHLALRGINPKIKVTCFEFQREIVCLSVNSIYGMGLDMHQKDILDLIGEDFEPYSHFFYWRPISNEDLMGTLIDRMIMWTKKGQVICFCSSSDGLSVDKLNKSKLFQLITQENGIFAYHRIK